MRGGEGRGGRKSKAKTRDGKNEEERKSRH